MNTPPSFDLHKYVYDEANKKSTFSENNLIQK